MEVLWLNVFDVKPEQEVVLGQNLLLTEEHLRNYLE